MCELDGAKERRKPVTVSLCGSCFMFYGKVKSVKYFSDLPVRWTERQTPVIAVLELLDESSGT